jgi:hypothetical protein
MKKIIFTNVSLIKNLELPKPADKYIPDWYKETNSYILNQKKPYPDGRSPATIKKCIPVFDAITSGYIIESISDVYISPVEKEEEHNNELLSERILKKTQEFMWSHGPTIDFHPLSQAPYHPYKKDDFRYPKWLSPWAIKTPKGYSCLFIQPMHRDSVFTILPGVVDTDKYSAPVNFPFVINDPNFEGLIPKGTPIAQVIPFKRDSWKNFLGNENDAKDANEIKFKLQQKFFDKYKSIFWDKKQYK